MILERLGQEVAVIDHAAFQRLDTHAQPVDLLGVVGSQLFVFALRDVALSLEALLRDILVYDMLDITLGTMIECAAWEMRAGLI